MDLKYKKGALILLSGLPGSGKSTFIENHFKDKRDYVISSDELRDRYFGKTNDFDKDGNLILSNNQEVSPLVFDIMKQIATKRLDENLTTVIDATNIDDNARNTFIKLGKWSEVITIIFDKDIEELKLNNLKRSKNGGRFVDEKILLRMSERFFKTTNIKGNKIYFYSDELNLIEDIPTVQFSKEEKVFIIGDSHGINDLKKYVDDIINKNENFKIIFLGDIVDRGDLSIDNLLYLYELSKKYNNIHFIKGNHEEKLLKNLIGHLSKEYKELTPAVYRTFHDFLDVFNNGYKGDILELQGKKYKVEEIINFLNKFNDFLILEDIDNNKRFLLSHGPFLPPDNLGNILKTDCIYGSQRFRLSSGEKLEYNYICSLNSYLKKNELGFICGHFDFQDKINQFEKNNNSKTNIYSLEGKVDSGGKLNILKIHNNEITKFEFDSGLNYNYKNFVKNDKLVFDSLLNEKIVTVNNNHDLYKNLFLYKYHRSVFYNHSWGQFDEKTNKVLELARGIVFDTSGNIISFPFEKVFNYGEKTGSNNNTLENKQYQFIEKFNGFLGIISADPYNKESLLIHTQGSLDNSPEFSFNRYIKELLSEDQKNNLVRFMNKNGKHTFMFEVIHKNDPHIVSYNEQEYGLKLIGARNISTNDINNTYLYKEDELDIIGKELGFERPKHFISDLSILENLKSEKNLEGYMVRDIKTNKHIVKIKTTSYLIAKFLGRMNEKQYAFLFSNKDKFLQSNSVEEEMFPIIDFIHNNKELFLNSSKEGRVQMITNFINSSLDINNKLNAKSLKIKNKLI